jgi:hypothetical protein
LALPGSHTQSYSRPIGTTNSTGSSGVAEGTGKALGMSQIFIGIVFLAIIGSGGN